MQSLEQELTKVHRAQEELVASVDRQGRLEREARARLQVDCRRLQELNRALREQLELVSSPRGGSAGVTSVASDAALRRELNQRDLVIAQLITSNKELVAAKERQEIELAAQRATLQEQRTHIDILDTALTNAQGNVVRLEDECRKKQMYVEMVAQLKTALASQQQASERREQTEHKLRLQLERELRAERSKSSAGESGQGYGSNGNGASLNPISESAPELKRKLRERDEKIMKLEGEVAKWEQRYLEESSMRQAAIDAASLPKDAKIAALEKTTQETEKIIAEARSEKIRYMDEVHAAQKKVADLESRLKELESKLAEKDAMIKVLQKHTYDKDVATSYPSLAYSDLSRQDLGPSTSVFSTVSSVLTSSTGFTSFSGCSDSSGKLFPSYHATTNVSDSGPKLSYHGDSSSKLSFSSESGPLLFSGDSSSKYGSFRVQSFDDSKKSLDDQLKELDSQLDSQLLSKRGLCCFPGFSNPSAAPRKGKISQPLLAGVVNLSAAATTSRGNARPEEMLLLEKQGRSSQRQRAGSLPPNSLPSSLPRPRRSRKLGEYGRLSDGETSRNPDSAIGFFENNKGEDTSSNGSLRFGRTSRKTSTEETLPPTGLSKLDFGYVRLKTPPGEQAHYRRQLSSDENSFVYPRLKFPENSSFLRKPVVEEKPPVGPTFVAFSRLKTPSPAPVVAEEDLSRRQSPKKSFIPPPRRLGEYGRFGSARSSSESAGARDSHDSSTPPRRGSSVAKDSNCRIRF